ncbi:hypothetical protein [Pseudobutyrivibrio sp.]
MNNIVYGLGQTYTVNGNWVKESVELYANYKDAVEALKKWKPDANAGKVIDICDRVNGPYRTVRYVLDDGMNKHRCEMELGVNAMKVNG